MDKHCTNCKYCEDMTNTITKEFAGFCHYHKSYCHCSYCSQFSPIVQQTKGEMWMNPASIVFGVYLREKPIIPSHFTHLPDRCRKWTLKGLYMDKILKEFLTLDVPESMCNETKEFIYNWMKSTFTSTNSKSMPLQERKCCAIHTFLPLNEDGTCSSCGR